MAFKLLSSGYAIFFCFIPSAIGQIFAMIHMASFLPPETVDMLSSIGPQFPDQLAFDTEMTIVFSDMRGFTQLSEQYDPRMVYAAINASLAIQTRLVLEYRGSVNKFLGDGLLACFSGADRSERAVLCVMEMLRILQQHETEKVSLPTPIGLGINDGHVLLGLLGTAERREFTVIGDVVNTAARLCGIAEPFHALITGPAMGRLPADMAARYCRMYCTKQFKGKVSPVDVYRIEI